MTVPFLSIIIPAYNEAMRIPATLVDVADRLSRADFSYEVIVVSDGSTDDTVATVERFIRNRREWRLIQNDHNEGKGGSVRRGMLAAVGQWRLFMDADNSTTLAELDQMRPLMTGAHRILIGSRALRGSRLEPPQPWYKVLGGKLGNLMIRTLVLPGVRDSQCGFKVFPAGAATRIFSELHSTGWGFDVEALALGRHHGFEVIELPVRWVNDPVSHVGFGGYLTTLRDVMEIRRRVGRAPATK